MSDKFVFLSQFYVNFWKVTLTTGVHLQGPIKKFSLTIPTCVWIPGCIGVFLISLISYENRVYVFVSVEHCDEL